MGIGVCVGTGVIECGYKSKARVLGKGVWQGCMVPSMHGKETWPEYMARVYGK